VPPRGEPSVRDDELAAVRYERALCHLRPNPRRLLGSLKGRATVGLHLLAALLPGAAVVGVLWLSPQLVASSWYRKEDRREERTAEVVSAVPASLLQPADSSVAVPSEASGATQASSAANSSMPKAAPSAPARPAIVEPTPAAVVPESTPDAPTIDGGSNRSNARPSPPGNLSVGSPQGGS
jgi:hypothetical protein